MLVAVSSMTAEQVLEAPNRDLDEAHAIIARHWIRCHPRKAMDAVAEQWLGDHHADEDDPPPDGFLSAAEEAFAEALTWHGTGFTG